MQVSSQLNIDGCKCIFKGGASKQGRALSPLRGVYYFDHFQDYNKLAAGSHFVLRRISHIHTVPINNLTLSKGRPYKVMLSPSSLPPAACVI